MKILVTGGCGSIGSHLIAELKEKHELTLFDLAPPQSQDCKHIKGDVLKPEEVRKAVVGMDAVIHLVGGHSSPDPFLTMNLNAIGTFNVLECMAQEGVPRLLHSSSNSVFGAVFSKKPFSPEFFPLDVRARPRPQDPYGLAKLAAEQMCRGYHDGYGMRIISIRHCWVWVKDDPTRGRAQYARRAEIAAKGDDGRETPLNIRRLWGYIDVSDVVRGYLLALEKIDEVGHEVVNLSAADTFSDEKSIDLIRKYYPGVKQVSEAYHTEPHTALYGHEKARKLLGWEPQVSWRDMV